MEFLTTLITNVPDGTPDETVDDTRSREAIRVAQLAEQGHLLRLWKPPVEPGEWRTLGLWRAESESELEYPDDPASSRLDDGRSHSSQSPSE